MVNILLRLIYLWNKFVSRLQIKRLDNGFIPTDHKEIRLFAIARNESLRLPYFLQYYFDRGVDRMFIIDNNSTDATAKILLEQENCHVFQTQESYEKHWHWMEFLLNRFGKGNWCIVVDIDELFFLPQGGKALYQGYGSFFKRRRLHSYEVPSAGYVLLKTDRRT